MEHAYMLVIPLTTTEDNVIRVGKTRVRLDTVVYAFNEGYSVEEIVSQYPTLKLSDVYAVIAYYLSNRITIDAYVAERAERGQTLRKEIESKPDYQVFRRQLLKRRGDS